MSRNCVRLAAGFLGCLLGVGVSIALAQAPALNLTLAWNASPDTNVAGYRVYQGTLSGSLTNMIDAGAQLQCTWSNLPAGVTNYFIAKAYSAEGLESDPTPELSYFSTNEVELSSVPDPTEPPLPWQGGSGGSTNQGPAEVGQTEPQPTNSAQSLIERNAKVTGIPPAISVASDGQQTMVGVLGTVGATYEIQRNVGQGPLLWTSLGRVVITNALTNAVDMALPAILNQAFFPGEEWYVDPEPSAGGVRYYRVVMPYDYPILADIILKPKGYDTRLVAVRTAGTDVHSLCYVTAESGYLRYLADQGTMQFAGSGGTVREMATRMAESISQNWTSASEFIYTNGAKLLVATVVKTDPASSDPLPGGDSTGIVIDF